MLWSALRYDEILHLFARFAFKPFFIFSLLLRSLGCWWTCVWSMVLLFLAGGCQQADQLPPSSKSGQGGAASHHALHHHTTTTFLSLSLGTTGTGTISISGIDWEPNYNSVKDQRKKDKFSIKKRPKHCHASHHWEPETGVDNISLHLKHNYNSIFSHSHRASQSLCKFQIIKSW